MMPFTATITILIIFALILLLIFYFWQQHKKSLATHKREPMINADLDYEITPQEPLIATTTASESPYNPTLVILQLRPAPGKLYMGYELLQSILAAGMRFGAMDIFHYHQDQSENSDILFSLAAATPNGTFAINNMGAYSCSGLVLFMKLDPTKKLLQNFTLMLETARQLVADLDGELLDELQQPLNAINLKQLRDKVAAVQNKKLFAANVAGDTNSAENIFAELNSNE